ncbi:hypothetical protein D3C75_843520 [compost metagenome]
MLLLTEHQHVRHLLQLGFADFVAQFLIPQIKLDADSGSLQLLFHLEGVIGIVIGDGQQLYLHRRQPQRKSTAEMLRNNPHEPVNGAIYRTVNDNWTVFLAVFADISQVELLRHLKIQLNGSALPASLQRIPNMKVNLRPVKSPVPRIHPVADSLLIQNPLQRCLRLVP